MGNSSSNECPILWKPTDQYVRWSDEKSMINKKTLGNALTGYFSSWKSFARDVQRNPEKYAQKMRESMDRDCARIHAVFIQGETSGTKYEPAKVVDFVNNLPGWAPNWARGNRVLKAGAAVLDHLPSTEPRASKSFDRDGNQVGMTWRVNMGKDNHNGRYRHWRFPLISRQNIPNDLNLHVAQPIVQYVKKYGGKTQYVLEVSRKYTLTIWPRRNLRHWEVEIVLLSLKRAPNFLAVRHFWSFAVLNERKRCDLYLKQAPDEPARWGSEKQHTSNSSWTPSRLLGIFGVSQLEVRLASKDCDEDASKVAESFLRFRRKGVLMAGYLKQRDAEYQEGLWGTLGYKRNSTKWFCITKEGYLLRFDRIHNKRCETSIYLDKCQILRVSDSEFMIVSADDKRYSFVAPDSKTCFRWCKVISYKVLRLKRERLKKFGGDCWLPPRVMRYIYATLRGY